MTIESSSVLKINQHIIGVRPSHIKHGTPESLAHQYGFIEIENFLKNQIRINEKNKVMEILPKGKIQLEHNLSIEIYKNYLLFQSKVGNEIFENRYNKEAVNNFFNQDKGYIVIGKNNVKKTSLFNETIDYPFRNYSGIILDIDEKKLVNILTKFTIDTPIKYTTHEWRNRIDDKYFDDFDLFLEDVSEQFKNLGSELKELSSNLYHKVEAFIVSTENPNSWKSMKDLKPWVESKNEPFDFPIANENILFKTIIESFKNEIEIRGNMLQEIFLAHKKRLGRAFKITISDNLKGEKFYTDVETFKNAVDEIFREIEKYAKEQNEYEIEVELFKPENNFIELHIIHVGSTSTREAIELLDRIKQEKGDSVLRGYFENLCDWEIKASHKNNNFTIDCFSEEIKNIEKPKGFTHIMRFYK